jgi:hypothetical protein
MDSVASAVDKSAVDQSVVDKNKSLRDPSPAERSIQHGDTDILLGEKVDEALAAKMVLINDVRHVYIPYMKTKS